jgi:hypothetical protein
LGGGAERCSPELQTFVNIDRRVARNEQALKRAIRCWVGRTQPAIADHGDELKLVSRVTDLSPRIASTDYRDLGDLGAGPAPVPVRL